ncbi:TetR/AcrR family transcriptional regulator [Streptomyces triticagri]|uniref:TetR/AcrR family transcriptional regulator n=1 Tax=Streptomyces triticagri TaxID=2293568 RepID=A0A372LXC2_9ACTN|nr:TetR/AcrR family transcriptional regulator [Streptomyces triticagri]RFU83050.1 TetR/AcrR family transcriptional regulator [Streptomyces triticagri]
MAAQAARAAAGEPGEPAEPRNEGLRERKKRRTRQHISDVATGMFLDRGFDSVTIAEIAEAAEVSVNTVYNYFPAKEDLFLDRSAGIVERLSRYVRARDVGESAAAAVLRELRAEVEAVSPRMGLFEGYAGFMRVLHDAPTLRARLWYVQQEALQHVVDTLREETDAAPDDPMPLLMGGQLAWLQSTLMAFIGGRMVRGEKANEVSRATLDLLDEIEDVWGETILNYAVRQA